MSSVFVLHLRLMNSHERRIVKRALAQSGIQISELSSTQSKLPIKENQSRQKLSRVLRIATLLHGQLWKVILGLTTLGGFGFWQLWPRVDIEPYTSLDPHSPFAQQFSVQNNSLYPLKNVQPRCRIDKIRSQGRPNLAMDNSTVIFPKERVESLSSSAKTTATCDLNSVFLRPEGSQYTDLKIAIQVDYSLPLPIHTRRCWEANFLGKRGVGNSYIWTYQDAADCPALSK
jgi:hypothetical protein